MSADHSPSVAALVERCMKGLAMSDHLYRDEWPDVGKTARDVLHKRVVAVLEATGVPLEALAGLGRQAGDVGGVVELGSAIPNVEVRRWGWWRK